MPKKELHPKKDQSVGVSSDRRFLSVCMLGLVACVEIPVCLSDSQNLFLFLVRSLLPFFSDYRGFLPAFPLLLTTPSAVATPAGQRRRCNATKSNPVGKHFHFGKAKTQLLIRKLKCQVQEGNS